jgi:hypothetical protein
MTNEPHIADLSSRPTALPLNSVWDRVDPLAPCCADPSETGFAELPYKALRGPGFERLIYELLQQENQQPWFFARSGFAQYGVDIVAETAGRQRVYQCKNEAEVPSFSTVRKAVKKFELKWLGDKKLPVPEAFVYCCPHPLDDGLFNEKWLRFKEEFQLRTGVALSFLDRHALDAKLRKLPDLVAGLFSDSYAEVFCGRDDWRDDPWTRVQYGPARFPSIKRFLDRHTRNAIYVDDEHEARFVAALDDISVLAIRGLPGLGKSFLALEMACRLRQPLRRIYYSTFKDVSSRDRLWQSARRRLSVPSVFILDDCHLAPDAAGTLLERLAPELESSKIKLVLLSRDQIGAGTGEADDTSGWLATLEGEQALVDLRADAARTSAVVRHLRPDWAGLADEMLKHLHDTCGGDLFLLDEILESVSSPHALEDLKVDRILNTVRKHYFGGNRQLPTVTKLAALAQFDISPRSDFFDGLWQQYEKQAADPLMTRFFGPARYRFLHSSLAGIVLRALAQLEVSAAELDNKIVAITSDALREYLQYLIGAASRSEEFSITLQQFLRAKLHLWTPLNDARMRTSVLGDTTVMSAIQNDLGRHNLATLALCVTWLAAAEDDNKTNYVRFVEEKLETLLNQPDTAEPSSADNISIAFRVLGALAHEEQIAILEKYGAAAVLRLVLTTSVVALFRLGSYLTPEFRNGLLDRLTPELTAELINKTIATRRSIGTINLLMRELREVAPDFLVRLELAISAEGFLRLILANGTIVDFFRVTQYATPKFRNSLLEQLTPEKAEKLLGKTVLARGSIGNLSWTLRELNETDPQLLAQLERTIGALGFVRLIRANGTLADLYNILHHATVEFRSQLVYKLSPQIVGEIIDKTIDNKQSVGTLHLGIRELRDTDPQLLRRIEQLITASSFVRLVTANGTLVEFFYALHYSTFTFRLELVQHLTTEQAQHLVSKTVAESRRIDSFHFQLRGLHESAKELAKLQDAVGVTGWWQLFTGCGSLHSIESITQAMDNTFRSRVIAAAASLSVFHWQEIITRGFFLNACTFVVKDLREYPENARSCFTAALAEVATELGSRASWFDLNASRLPTDVEDETGVILKTALRTRLESVQLPELFDLDFREALNAFVCCWQERPDLRSDLVKNIEQILPSRQVWPRKKGEVGAVRLVLAITRSEGFPKQQAIRLLNELTAFLDREVCDNIHTMPLFLLVWNMWAVYCELENGYPLEEVFTPTLQEYLVDVLTTRATKKNTPIEEKLALFALGGLLAFLFRARKKQVAKSLATLTLVSKWLVPLAMEHTFVPAFFKLQGIALLLSENQVFNRQNRKNLLGKVTEYEDIGTAVENLRQQLHRKTSNPSVSE